MGVSTFDVKFRAGLDFKDEGSQVRGGSDEVEGVDVVFVEGEDLGGAPVHLRLGL